MRQDIPLLINYALRIIFLILVLVHCIVFFEFLSPAVAWPFVVLGNIVTLNWVSAPGLVYNVGFNCKSHRGVKHVDADFTFIYKSKQYHGEIFTYDGLFPFYTFDCGQAIEQHFKSPDGKPMTTTVYFNPNNPKESALQLGVPPLNKVFLLGMRLFIVFRILFTLIYTFDTYEASGKYPLFSALRRRLLMLDTLEGIKKYGLWGDSRRH